MLNRRGARLSLAVLPLALLLLTPAESRAWGFEAHKFIAEQVIALLPPGLRELVPSDSTFAAMCSG